MIGLAAVGAIGAGLVSAALPAAAQQRTLILTLLNGTKVTLSLDVPPGTPLDKIKLPPVVSPIVAISLAPAGVTGSGAPIPGVPPVTLPGGGTPGGINGQGVPSLVPLISSQSAQRTTGHKRRKPAPLAKLAPRLAVKKAKVTGTPIRAANGLPTALNPTLSLASFGAAPIGVPNFFIDNFRIPPFLLPIYQAAGVEYDVPWQVLAAVNEIETDYGRNLSVSSAGAIGWMQFLPATWLRYGVDANGDGVKDPYNPVDAIFGAARYLHAAGASQNLRGAIFAYNHAGWYVDSVLLRAKLIGGLPPQLVSSITGLTEGRFPVGAASRYADDISEAKIQARAAKAHNAAVLVQGSASRTAIDIYAKSGAPVVAVQDGTIVGMGESQRFGRYIKLRDAYGNTYTYGQLSSLAPVYPVPKAATETAAHVASDLRLPGLSDPKPLAPASAGHQAAAAAKAPLVATINHLAQVTDTSTPGQLRLFAHPSLPGAYAAGGKLQLAGTPSSLASAASYTKALGLNSGDAVLRTLRKGAHVVAGTILGRIGKTSPLLAPHVMFALRPAGKGSPPIDPKPILDGWKLLETTAVYRAADKNPFFGPDSANPTIGQILLESKDQLQQRVLSDPNVTLYSCGRNDIATGQIDRRVLATLEFLSASGLKPSVSALKCGHSLLTTTGNISEHASGNAVDIAAINSIPIIGHQGPGSIADIAIRRLLTLQGIFKPHQIISLMRYSGSDNTFAMPDHANHIHIGFMPEFDPNSKIGQAITAALKPDQWIKLIARLSQIDNPVVAAKPSKSAIPDGAAPTGD